jgi:hypothetical protein
VDADVKVIRVKHMSFKSAELYMHLYAWILVIIQTNPKVLITHL